MMSDEPTQSTYQAATRRADVKHRLEGSRTHLVLGLLSFCSHPSLQCSLQLILQLMDVPQQGLLQLSLVLVKRVYL